MKYRAIERGRAYHPYKSVCYGIHILGHDGYDPQKVITLYRTIVKYSDPFYFNRYEV